ncbi:alpha/beta hydrolase [Sphingosinicella soli]|uniref:Acetyl esterase/lipase n=1 Tax=Sphingosinicella soli TaxID=333708 RepID=A0A7W7B233_9SPHN|nr:alpha/beta hydrolase [Sphingosinicella soli]MBB4632589.1 acetyl esterase/lipase [Sphingosinicella soli]
MQSGYSMQIRGAVAVLLLCSGVVPALAQQPAIDEDVARQFAEAAKCSPSEVTDPQALHINGSKPFVYKRIGEAKLRLHVFTPAGRKAGARSPAVVFFYGGGFIFGDIRRFQTQATHLALRGIVTVLVDYRVKCRHGSSILDSIADAKSAMRWVRGHADEFGIDSSRIAAAGSSAGGHLAAATALVPGFDDPADEKIDVRPNALILYNPGLDTGAPAARARMALLQGKAVADRGREFSPFDHIERGLPPTIIFQGTADVLTPIEIAEQFCLRAEALQSQCELVSYDGAPHGFTEIWMGLEDASLGVKTEEWAEDTMRRTDAFLTKLGWLPQR